MDRCFGMVLLVVYEILKDVSLNNFVIYFVSLLDVP